MRFGILYGIYSFLNGNMNMIDKTMYKRTRTLLSQESKNNLEKAYNPDNDFMTWNNLA